MPVLFPRIRTLNQAVSRAAQKALPQFLSEVRIKYQLAACLLFKDVAIYLAEWIDFHAAVGVEKFYLYNNGSSDDYKDVLAPYVSSGLVALHEWPAIPAFPSAYEHCTANYRREARWIAMIDDDEFLFPTTENSLVKVLSKYENHPAVAVHWAMFGSNGHVARPPGLVIENYTWRAAILSNTVKSIVNPRRIRSHKSTHYALYTGHQFAVNEKFQTVKTSSSDSPTTEVLRINHYWSKSKEDYLKKINRGFSDEWTRNNPRDLAMFDRAETKNNQMEDSLILRFLPMMRR